LISWVFWNLSKYPFIGFTPKSRNCFSRPADSNNESKATPVAINEAPPPAATQPNLRQYKA